MLNCYYTETKRLQERIRDGTDKWENVAEDMRQLGEEILGEISGKTKHEIARQRTGGGMTKCTKASALVAKKTVDGESTEANKIAYIRQEEASQENSRCG